MTHRILNVDYKKLKSCGGCWVLSQHNCFKPPFSIHGLHVSYIKMATILCTTGNYSYSSVIQHFVLLTFIFTSPFLLFRCTMPAILTLMFSNHWPDFCLANSAAQVLSAGLLAPLPYIFIHWFRLPVTIIRQWLKTISKCIW